MCQASAKPCLFRCHESIGSKGSGDCRENGGGPERPLLRCRRVGRSDVLMR